MMELFRHAWILAQKDIKVELRRIHEPLSIVFFALACIVVSSFSWKNLPMLKPEVVATLLWVIEFFSSILVLTTSFTREVDKGTIDGLRSLPCSPLAIFLGKTLYGFASLLIVVAAMLASSILLLGIPPSLLPKLTLIILLGTIDLSISGSLLSAILMYSEGKSLLLAFLLLPLSVPVLLPGINGAAKALQLKPWGVLVPELRLLLSIGLVVVSVAILFFQEVFAE